MLALGVKSRVAHRSPIGHSVSSFKVISSNKEKESTNVIRLGENKGKKAIMYSY